MPEEPQNKMDELLKACAKKRAEQSGAPFELHPATRSMLQAEVSRRFPGAKEKPGFVIPHFRFVFALGALALVALCAVMVYPSHSAKQTSDIVLVSNNSASTAPAAPEGSVLDITGSSTVNERSLTIRRPVPSAPAAAPVPLPPAASAPGTATQPAVAFADAPAAGFNLQPLPSAPSEKMADLPLVGRGFTMQPSAGQGQGQGQGAVGGDMGAAAAPATIDDRGTIVLKTNSTQNKALLAKLDRIIIPRVEFRDATVREAIDYLKKRSQELDPDDRKDAGKRVDGALKLNRDETTKALAMDQFKKTDGTDEVPSLTTADAASPADAKITISLTNVPLSDALRAVTRAAGLKVELASGTVAIVPANQSAFVEQDYAINTGLLEKNTGLTINAGAMSGGLANNNARLFLEQQGVSFPPGSDAYLIPNTNTLVVNNTAANQSLVKAVVEKKEEPRDMVANNKDAEAAKEAVARKTTAAFNLLTSFHVEIKGSRVRIIDSDGSVYTGEISNAELQKQMSASDGLMFNNVAQESRFRWAAAAQNGIVQAPQSQMKQQQQMISAATSNSAAPTQNYSNGPTTGASFGGNQIGGVVTPQSLYFRVTGTNATLNKPVTIEGVYLAGSSVQFNNNNNYNYNQTRSLGNASNGAAAAGGGIGGNVTGQDKQGATLSTPARIQGQAQIGARTLDIDAVAAAATEQPAVKGKAAR